MLLRMHYLLVGSVFVFAASYAIVRGRRWFAGGTEADGELALICGVGAVVSLAYLTYLLFGGGKTTGK